MILYFLLCFIQPICLPIPEAATVLAGTLVIGEFASLLLGVIGLVMGITVMFFLTRKIGERFLHSKMVSYKSVVKYLEYAKQNPILITGVLFVIPALPDEVIVVGASLSGIPFKILLPIAIITKTVSVGMIAYAEQISSFLPLTRWQLLAVELFIVFIVAAIFRLIKKRKSDVDGTIKEIEK